MFLNLDWTLWNIRARAVWFPSIGIIQRALILHIEEFSYTLLWKDHFELVAKILGAFWVMMSFGCWLSLFGRFCSCQLWWWHQGLLRNVLLCQIMIRNIRHLKCLPPIWLLSLAPWYISTILAVDCIAVLMFQTDQSWICTCVIQCFLQEIQTLLIYRLILSASDWLQACRALFVFPNRHVSTFWITLVLFLGVMNSNWIVYVILLRPNWYIFGHGLPIEIGCGQIIDFSSMVLELAALHLSSSWSWSLVCVVLHYVCDIRTSMIESAGVLSLSASWTNLRR